MKPERLQEIKNFRLLKGNEEWTSQEDVDTEADFIELIAAYENQGELLQLSLANVDRLNEELADAVEMLADCGVYVTDEKGEEYVTLRKQLAEAQAELAGRDAVLAEWRNEWENDPTVIDLRKQLAEMEKERDIACDCYNGLRIKLDMTREDERQ